jgi:Mg-chelatase subunit ChlD/ribosomal protein S7
MPAHLAPPPHQRRRTAADTAVAVAAAPAGAISLVAAVEVPEVLCATAETVFGMASVVSSAAAPTGSSSVSLTPTSPEQRAGVDIVAVVDRSGSMQGEKIALLKQSLQYMLTQLGPRDRMSIVSFNSGAEFVCGLRRMDAAGVASVSALIEASPHLYAQGGTAIWEGLRKGLRTLSERTERNPVCTILLLTDGQDSAALNAARGSFEGAAAVRIEGLSLHSFGFGTDHDAPVCSGLAALGHGTFSFIEAVNQLGPAFATALGGLLSVSAQELTLTVTPASPGVSIVRAHTHYKTVRDTAAGSVSVFISDLYSGERRDMLFEVSVPATPEPPPAGVQTLADVRLSFAAAPDFDRSRLEHRETTFQVLRPAKVSDAVSRNQEIEVQRFRIAAADSMSRAIALANTGKHDQAKEILRNQIAAITTSASARHPVCASLVADLNECQKRVEPKHFRSGGLAYMQSVQMQSAQQRSVASPSPSTILYSTPM